MDQNTAASTVPARAKRDSNLELGRIFAMFCIVAYHFCIHSGAPVFSDKAPLTFNLYFDQVIGSGGRMGVDLFILISGYFLALKISRFSSLVRLWITTVLYAVVIYLLFAALSSVEFTWGDFLQNLLPIKNRIYWFISSYFMLILLSPFLTLGLKSISQKQLLVLLIVFGVVWSLLPTLSIETPGYYFSNLTWFAYLFCWGAYLRRGGIEDRLKKGWVWLILIGTWLLIVLSMLLIDLINRHVGFIGYISPFIVADKESILSLIVAISLFLLFRTWKIGSISWINKAAATMLGVYLIHDNPFIRDWLWKALDVQEYFVRPIFPLWAVIVILLVFVSCTLLSLVVDFLVKKFFDRFLQQRLNPVDKSISDFFTAK